MPDVAKPGRRGSPTRRQVPGAAAVVVAMLAAAVLAWIGLDDQLFWDDEANTAIYARNLIRRGRLTAWDGRNLVGYAYGGSLGEDLGRELRVPALPAYVAAAGMWLVGQTTLGGRVPFVVAGVLSVGLLAMWLRRHLGRRFAVWLPSLILALSPAYLLYIRNCRYYALGVMFTLLVWTCWAPGSSRRRMPSGPWPDRRELWRWVVGAAAILLLLSTHYLNAAAALLSLPLFLLDRRYRQPQQYALLGVIYAAAVLYGIWILATVNPFAADYRIAQDSYLVPQVRTDRWTHFYTNAWWFLRDLGTHEFFPWCLVAVLAVPWLPIPRWWARMRRLRPLALRGWILVAIVVATAVLAAALTPPDMGLGPAAEMRYVVPLLALGGAVAAVCLVLLWRLARPLAIAAFLVLVGTNTLHLGFFAQRFDGRSAWSSTLSRYVQGSLSTYQTGTKAMVGLLRRLPAGTTVRVWPGYMSYPPMFYAPELHYCDQLTEDKRISEELRPLPDYLFVERARPDVILVPVPFVYEALGRPPIDRAAPDSDFRYGADRYKLTTTLGPYWQYTSKPEIPAHFFSAPPSDWRRYPGMAVLVRSTSPVAEHPALATDPHDADALYRLGLALKNAGKTEAAAGRLAEALRIDPNHAAAHYHLGLVWLERGLLLKKGKTAEEIQEAVERAIGHFETVIRINPGDASAYLRLGSALQVTGDWDEALGYCRTALEMCPDSPTAHFNLANILQRRGAVDEATYHYRKTLELDPKYAKAYVNLGKVLTDRGRVDEAMELFRTALRYEPKLAEAHLNLGIALCAHGNKRAGIAKIREALELVPPDSPPADKIREILEQFQRQ